MRRLLPACLGISLLVQFTVPVSAQHANTSGYHYGGSSSGGYYSRSSYADAVSALAPVAVSAVSSISSSVFSRIGNLMRQARQRRELNIRFGRESEVVGRVESSSNRVSSTRSDERGTTREGTSNTQSSNRNAEGRDIASEARQASADAAVNDDMSAYMAADVSMSSESSGTNGDDLAYSANNDATIAGTTLNSSDSLGWGGGESELTGDDLTYTNDRLSGEAAGATTNAPGAPEASSNPVYPQPALEGSRLEPRYEDEWSGSTQDSTGLENSGDTQSRTGYMAPANADGVSLNPTYDDEWGRDNAPMR